MIIFKCANICPGEKCLWGFFKVWDESISQGRFEFALARNLGALWNRPLKASSGWTLLWLTEPCAYSAVGYSAGTVYHEKFLFHFPWFSMLFSEPIKCLYLPHIRIMVVVGKPILVYFSSARVNFEECHLLGGDILAMASHLRESQWGPQTRAQICQNDRLIPSGKKPFRALWCIPNYSRFRFYFSKFVQEAFHHFFSSSML